MNYILLPYAAAAVSDTMIGTFVLDLFLREIIEENYKEHLDLEFRVDRICQQSIDAMETSMTVMFYD